MSDCYEDEIKRLLDDNSIAQEELSRALQTHLDAIMSPREKIRLSQSLGAITRRDADSAILRMHGCGYMAAMLSGGILNN